MRKPPFFVDPIDLVGFLFTILKILHYLKIIRAKKNSQWYNERTFVFGVEINYYQEEIMDNRINYYKIAATGVAKMMDMEKYLGSETALEKN